MSIRESMPFILFMLLFCLDTKGQSHILNIQDKEKRLNVFSRWAHDSIYSEKGNARGNRQNKLAFLNDIYNEAKEDGDGGLAQEAWFDIALWKIGGAVDPFQPSESSATQILEAAEEAKSEGWQYAEARCRMTAASIYFKVSYYDPSFNQAKTAYKLIRGLSTQQFPQAKLYVADLANFYFHFMEYDSTVKLMKQAIDVRSPWDNMPGYCMSLNTLGRAYYELDRDDSAIMYYRMAYQSALQRGDSFLMAEINGNLGQCYFDSGMDSLALPLLLQDFERAIKTRTIAGIENNAGKLFVIYLKRHNIQFAKKYLSCFQSNMDSSNVSSRAKLYRYLSDISGYENNFKVASNYLDSSLYFQAISRKLHDKEVQERRKQRVAVEVYSSRIRVLESTQKRQESVRNSLIGMILLLFLIVMLFANRVRLKKNADVKTAQMEKRVVAEELKRAQTELNSFTRLLKEKNEMIEKFRNNVETLEMLESEGERVNILAHLTQASILTEKDWQQFRLLFDKVYPDFFVRLQQLVSALTPTDMRLMALTKLQITQKDMATMLGMGYDAVRKARQRLRSKIYPESEGSIEELIRDM